MSSKSLLFCCILICPCFVNGSLEEVLCCYHRAVMQGIALALHGLQHTVHRLYECNAGGRVKSLNTCPTFLTARSRCCKEDSVMD
uniref:Putative secreted protein n=1 Tax=Amblyomma triste TaxID=251400 RepID=A0A023G1G4_AMBTT